MHSVKNKALRCACGLLMTHSGISFASSEVSVLQQLPPLFISSEEKTSDWIQANKKVAELGGWQFYMQEAGGHAAMDHSQHSGHSGHKAEPAMDHSQHSGHATSKQTAPKPAAGDQHEHHH